MFDQTGLSKLLLKTFDALKTNYTPPKDTIIDLLWHSAYFLKKCRPGWSGFMSDLSVGEQYRKADFTMLPIIDLDLYDYSCLCSTLVFNVNQVKQLNIRTPYVTFELPLWVKALDMINVESFDLVLLLGRLRITISFVGTIDVFMNGSGFSYGIRLSHILEIPSISNEKPSISIEIPSISIENLGF